MAAPKNRLSALPPWISRWLGYRSTPVQPISQHLVWFWAFVGAFCGISLIQAVFSQAEYFVRRGVPPIVASYGASAVLIYAAVDSPLAQPRSLLGGHFFGALTGIIITKLFNLLPPARFADLTWLAGSLSCATSIVVMQVTGTVHPPAGATALLAATNADVKGMGWYYLPVVLLSSSLALVVALMVDNIQRRYPTFWLAPPTPPSPSLSASVPAPASVAPQRPELPKYVSDVSTEPCSTAPSTHLSIDVEPAEK